MKVVWSDNFSQYLHLNMENFIGEYNLKDNGTNFSLVQAQLNVVSLKKFQNHRCVKKSLLRFLTRLQKYVIPSQGACASQKHETNTLSTHTRAGIKASVRCYAKAKDVYSFRKQRPAKFHKSMPLFCTKSPPYSRQQALLQARGQICDERERERENLQHVEFN